MGAEGSGTAEHPVSKRCRYKGSWNSFQVEIKTSYLTKFHSYEPGLHLLDVALL
jgi:hypothetical protein